MSEKIIEKKVEPSKIHVGSFFKLKIRIAKNRYTLGELKTLNCKYLKTMNCKEIKEGG